MLHNTVGLSRKLLDGMVDENKQHWQWEKLYQELIDIFDRKKIRHFLIDGTSDIWARDYMPVQKKNELSFVQFKYNPDYSQAKKYKHLHKNPEEINYYFDCLDIEDSEIILDGGNIEIFGDFGICTDTIFKNNKSIGQEKLNSCICLALNLRKLYIVPHQPNDFTGHIDGILRIVGGTLLYFDHRPEKEYYRKKIIRSIERISKSEGLNLVMVPNGYDYASYANTNSAVGCYMNFLHLNGLILVPQYGGLLTETDKEVLRIFQGLETNAEIVPIDCSYLAQRGGVLNCIAWSFHYPKVLLR